MVFPFGRNNQFASLRSPLSYSRRMAGRVEAEAKHFLGEIRLARLRLLATPRQSSLGASLKRRLVGAAGVEPEVDTTTIGVYANLPNNKYFDIQYSRIF